MKHDELSPSARDIAASVLVSSRITRPLHRFAGAYYPLQLSAGGSHGNPQAEAMAWLARVTSRCSDRSASTRIALRHRFRQDTSSGFFRPDSLVGVKPVAYSSCWVSFEPVGGRAAHLSG
jgi:hypothetical protein